MSGDMTAFPAPAEMDEPNDGRTMHPELRSVNKILLILKALPDAKAKARVMYYVADFVGMISQATLNAKPAA